MIDGRKPMHDQLLKELDYLAQMRAKELANIEEFDAKLKGCHDRMDRWEMRTEMCERLRDSLEIFQAGLDALRDIGSTPVPPVPPKDEEQALASAIGECFYEDRYKLERSGA